MEKEKATLIDAYEKEKENVKAVYDEQMSKVEKDFNGTICGKDSYIAELEQGISWYKEQLEELNNRIKSAYRLKIMKLLNRRMLLSRYITILLIINLDR